MATLVPQFQGASFPCQPSIDLIEDDSQSPFSLLPPFRDP